MSQNDNFAQSIIRDLVSRVRAVFVVQSDERGPRISGGIHLDHGQDGYELPAPPKKRARKRAAKKSARRTKRS